MYAERTVKVLMAGQALVLLVPSTLLYFAGALGWFVLWGGAILLTVIEGIRRVGLVRPIERIIQEGWGHGYTMSLGFSVFMLAAGAGIAATWMLLGIGYSGGSLKKVPRGVWFMLACGWLAAAIPLGIVGDLQRLMSNPQFWSLIGIGPLLSSLFILAWLYWLGRRQTPNPAYMDSPQKQGN